jgi:hypothetical protein
LHFNKFKNQCLFGKLVWQNLFIFNAPNNTLLQYSSLFVHSGFFLTPICLWSPNEFYWASCKFNTHKINIWFLHSEFSENYKKRSKNKTIILKYLHSPNPGAGKKCLYEAKWFYWKERERAKIEKSEKGPVIRGWLRSHSKAIWLCSGIYLLFSRKSKAMQDLNREVEISECVFFKPKQWRYSEAWPKMMNNHMVE